MTDAWISVNWPACLALSLCALYILHCILFTWDWCWLKTDEHSKHRAIRTKRSVLHQSHAAHISIVCIHLMTATTFVVHKSHSTRALCELTQRSIGFAIESNILTRSFAFSTLTEPNVLANIPENIFNFYCRTRNEFFNKFK